MKKNLCILFCVLIVSLSFADMNPPHRYFELGMDVDVSLANNWLSVSDFFQETLVLDFTKVASDLKDGVTVDLNSEVTAFMNINFGKTVRIGFFAGVDGMGMVNLSQSLLEFVAKGNASGNHSVNGAVGMDLAVYAEAGFSVQAFFDKLGIGVTPTVFVPAVYVPRVKANASLKMQDDGSMTACLDANVAAYTPFSLNEPEFAGAPRYFSDAGMDISVSAEYALFPNLDIGVAVNHIPTVPAKLRHKMTYSASGEYNIDPIIDTLFEDEDDENSEEEFSFDDPVYEELASPYALRRPVELCIGAAFRPFGDWFDVKGNIDLVFYKPIYLNFTVEGGLHFIRMGKLGGHMLNLSLKTGYDERVWTQQFTLGLNLRVLELNLSVSSRGTEFVKSFMGNGLGVGVGFRLGF